MPSSPANKMAVNVVGLRRGPRVERGNSAVQWAADSLAAAFLLAGEELWLTDGPASRPPGEKGGWLG